MDKYILGKDVRVIMDDLGRATPKNGKAVSIDDHFVIIAHDIGFEAIPHHRIIRIEILN